MLNSVARMGTCQKWYQLVCVCKDVPQFIAEAPHNETLQRGLINIAWDCSVDLSWEPLKRDGKTCTCTWDAAYNNFYYKTASDVIRTGWFILVENLQMDASITAIYTGRKQTQLSESHIA